MVESNIPHLRKLNFTEALQPYLKSKDKDNHLTALAGLAAIIDEEESEIINSNKKVVKHLMKVLRRALRQDDRRYDGWSCKELALGEYASLYVHVIIPVYELFLPYLLSLMGHLTYYRTFW